MSSPDPIRRDTVQDYRSWPDDVRCELIHGQVYDMTPASSLDHQAVAVGGNLRVAVWSGKLCRTHRFSGSTSAMETQKLTVRLPADDIAYLKDYARQRGITVTEALHRYLRTLRGTERAEIHPEVSRFTGLVPSDVGAREVYARHLESKHT